MDMADHAAYIGTAGWSIASRHRHRFSGCGTQLERYAGVLNTVEMNSSFHRPHRRQTYERWAASVPDDFRFSVKMPKTITHEERLANCDRLLDAFLGEASGLGSRLGVVMVQLPPSLEFDRQLAKAFFERLPLGTDADIACEPRHASWFADEADAVLQDLRIARVAADPPRSPQASEPGGWNGLAYFRMHGSPRVYYSDYPVERLVEVRERLALAGRSAKTTWCIFDNTAHSHALGNALDVSAMLR